MLQELQKYFFTYLPQRSVAPIS